MRLGAADLIGWTELAISGVVGIADLVESMHETIARGPLALVSRGTGRTRGITGIVYKSVRGTTQLIGRAVGAGLDSVVPLCGERPSSFQRETLLAALSGILGDQLLENGNPLTASMRLRGVYQSYSLDFEALQAAIPESSRKVLLLVHGVCLSDLQWTRQGHNHGQALAAALGFTPLSLRYNSGLHISRNGQALAEILERLISEWPEPIEELAILGFSMGGLVSRSAVHLGRAAGHEWPRRLRKLIFLGTPHHGAPMERGGNWINEILGFCPYSRPFARIGQTRSVGITISGTAMCETRTGRDMIASSMVTLDSRYRCPRKSNATLSPVLDRIDPPTPNS